MRRLRAGIVEHRAGLAIFLVALAVRLWFVAQPFDALDRGFVPDDTYYTLSVARNMAAGRGPIADSDHLTNGFQPLIAFLMVPVYWLTRDATAPVRIAALLGALADSAAAVLLFGLAAEAWGRRAGLLAGWIWALSPIAVANSLCGLETSLALAISLLLVQIAGEVRGEFARAEVWACGVTAGLAVLARIDTALLCLLVAVLMAWHKGPGVAARVAAIALLVVSPWWSYELWRFGTVVPESGAAVRLQTTIHHALGTTPQTQVIWGLGYGVMPVVDIHSLRNLLLDQPTVRFALAVLVAAGLWWIAKPALSSATAAIRLLAGFACCMLIFYSLLVPALWFFKRYLAPVEALSVLLFSWVLSRMVEKVGGRALGRALAVAVLLPGITQLGLWMVFGKPLDVRYNGAKGYALPARAVLRDLASREPTAALGAFQSGALAYFAAELPGHPIRVVNLDGVVNRSAFEALRSHRLRDYLDKNRILYLADWPLNVEAMARFVAASRVLGVAVVYLAPDQGVEGFILARVLAEGKESPRP